MAAAVALLDRMSRRLVGTGLLVLSGASGAGKSSLLRAGVLPRIRADGLAAAPGAARWPCVAFTPTRTPLDELALRVALLAGIDNEYGMAPAQRNRPLRCPAADPQRAFLHVTYERQLELRADPWLKVAVTK